ncbi:molybdate ABC transporter substrate-binding protein [Nocardioides caldifontis]|uniref:molybdate ABC transporter substrate-binding protein n=1 Tax=Nocardioides caldifontis TaxID=2588938 RepID=UPI0011E0676E|nr:molybdate ABC transporter substrate-binding protein [Nocardioides caldifontis]
MSRWLVPVLVPAVVLGLAGCGAGGRDDGRTTLVVYAAASLTATFEQLGERFEAEHEGVDVELAFAGSSDLVAQLQGGAPADVLASADETTMQKAVDDGLVAGGPRVFATNTMRIAVPPDNPAGVESLEDLAAGDLALVVCAPQVPCGAAAQEVAETAGVTLAPVSEEQSVTDVLAKVSSGEADAGLVYVTDVLAAGDAVRGIDFPESGAAENAYPVAVLEEADEPELAREFVDLLLGDEGRRVLADAGFGTP